VRYRFLCLFMFCRSLAPDSAFCDDLEERQLHLGFYPTRSRFFASRIHSSFLKTGKIPGGCLALGDLNGDGMPNLVMGEEACETRLKDGITIGVVILAMGGIPDEPTMLDHHVRHENQPYVFLFAGKEIPDAHGLALGHAVAVGDLSGDGVDDLLISQTSSDLAAKLSVPRVHFIWGRREGFPGHVNLQVQACPGAQGSDVVVYGPPQSGFGASLACGDLSGDGKMDLLIGAPFYGEDRTGALFVLWGRETWPRVVDLRTSPPDVLMTIPVPGAALGWSMVVQDLDGDGSCEVVVSAPGVPVRKNLHGGKVLLLNCEVGQEGQPILYTASEMAGDSRSQFLGSSLAVGKIGGRAHLAVGASGGTDPQNSSEVYLVPIGEGLTLPASVEQIGMEEGMALFHDPGRMGSVLAMGDLNGDGEDELVIGMQDHMAPAFDWNMNLPGCGRILILSPRSVFPRRSDLRVALPQRGVFLDIYGGEMGGQLGSDVLLADMNRDGTTDLVVKSRGLSVGPQEMRPSTSVILELHPRSGFLPGIPPAPNPDTVLLLINEASPDSVQIAEHYAKIRPGVKEFRLRVTVPEDELGQKDEISLEHYWAEIAEPLCEKLDSEGWWNEVRYLVTTKGFPLRLGNQASLDGQLCLLTVDWRDGKRRKRDHATPLSNPYAYQHHPMACGLKDVPPAIFLVTRLTGFTVQDTIAALDQAQAPQGAFLFPVVVDNDLRACEAKKTHPLFLRSVKDRLEDMNALVIYDETPRWVVEAKEQVSGYVSWGLNSSQTQGKGPAYISKALKFDYAPGAAFLTIESFNAWTFQEARRGTAPHRQGLLADFLREGGTCGIGNVAEPTLNKTARPDVFFVRLALGFCLADAAYASMGWVGWRQVVVGDPLMQWPSSRRVF